MIEIHFYAQHPEFDHAYSEAGKMMLPKIPSVGEFFFCDQQLEVNDPGKLRIVAGEYKINKISYDLVDGHVTCYGQPEE